MCVVREVEELNRIHLSTDNKSNETLQSSIGIRPLGIVSDGYKVVVRIILIKLFKNKPIRERETNKFLHQHVNLFPNFHHQSLPCTLRVHSMID